MLSSLQVRHGCSFPSRRSPGKRRDALSPVFPSLLWPPSNVAVSLLSPWPSPLRAQSVLGKFSRLFNFDTGAHYWLVVVRALNAVRVFDFVRVCPCLHNSSRTIMPVLTGTFFLILSFSHLRPIFRSQHENVAHLPAAPSWASALPTRRPVGP